VIHVQLVRRNRDDLQSLIRIAIKDGQIRSFQIDRVQGGFQISHKKYLGIIKFQRTSGPLLATIQCKNPKKEWQIFEAFVGRIADHFTDEIAAINIQMQSPD
jgi:hypothetical protein